MLASAVGRHSQSSWLLGFPVMTVAPPLLQMTTARMMAGCGFFFRTLRLTCGTACCYMSMQHIVRDL